MNRIYLSTPVVLLVALLQACGGGGSSDADIMGRTGTNKVRLSIDITDAPVTNVAEVWVQFTGLSIKPANGDVIDFMFDSPRNINLLNLQAGKSESLIRDELVLSGQYEWIRLHVNAENDGVMDSYLVLSAGATHELDVPNANTTGIIINNVGSFIADTHESLTIDFDLSKSLVLNAGEYKLKPVLRLMHNDLAESISGNINPELLTGNCTDSDPNTNNAVYVFVNGAVPDDIDGDSSDPITVARVLYNNATGDYEYKAAFLPKNRYTVAFTCQADLDDPEAEDTLVFSNVRNNVATTGDDSLMYR